MYNYKDMNTSGGITGNFPSTGTLPVQPGTARSYDEVAACLTLRLAATNCSNDVMCATGTKGRLCATCRASYYLSSRAACSPCSGGRATEAWVLLCLSIALLCAASWRVWHGRMTFDAGRFKVVCSFLQLVGSSSFILDMDWPEPFRALSRLASISLLSLYDTIPTGGWRVSTPPRDHSSTTK